MAPFQNDGFVESYQAAVTALLNEPGKFLRDQFTRRVADSAEISAGTLVNKEAARDVNPDHGSWLPGGVAYGEFADAGIKRRLHRIIADVANPALHDIEVIQLTPRISRLR